MTVYLFGNTGENYLKIGCTHTPVNFRLSLLIRGDGTFIPDDVDVNSCELLGVYYGYSFELESWLHKYFEEYLILGEWFSIQPYDVDAALTIYDSLNKEPPRITWTCNHNDRKLGKRCTTCKKLACVRMCLACGRIISIKYNRRRKFCDSKCQEKHRYFRIIKGNLRINRENNRAWFASIQDHR